MAVHELEEESAGPGEPLYEGLRSELFPPSVFPGPRWAHSVRCRLCGHRVASMAPGLPSDAVREHARSTAWDAFLERVPWDCEEALVEAVMGS